MESMNSQRRPRARAVAVVALLAALLVLAGCGGNGGDAAQEGASEAAATPTPALTVVLTPLPVDQPVSPLLGASPLPTPTPQQRIAAEGMPLEQGKAAVVGRVISAATGQPLANVQLRLGEIFCPDGATDLTEEEKRTQCAVILDDAWNPFAESDAEGRFAFANIEARDYTFMAGYDSPGAPPSVTALNAQGDPIIYTALADQTVDLGDVVVNYQP